MDVSELAEQFFTDYASALLDRDADAIAEMYAVPALILFPGQSLPVTSESQTREFFAGSMGQYDGVSEASPSVTVVAAAEHSLWCDVTWAYGGEPQERFMYQLVEADHSWKIAVLTPLPVSS